MKIDTIPFVFISFILTLLIYIMTILHIIFFYKGSIHHLHEGGDSVS